MYINKLLFVLIFFVFVPIFLFSQSLEITTPDSLSLMVSDSLPLAAVYTDTSGNAIDTTLSWFIQPDSLGFIDNHYFMAEKAGTGFIFASLDTLLDSIYIMIMPQKTYLTGQLQILPPDTTIQVGNLVQFKTQFIDTHEVVHDTSAAWFVKRDLIGPISEDGTLFAFFPGQAEIMAKLDTLTATAHLTVVDTTSDTTGLNEIKVYRVFPDGKEKKPKIIKEGESYVIGGMPHPLNVINGGIVYFPIGSLHEDISLVIQIPKIAKIKQDSVEFMNRILNGIQFDVFVNDSLIEPYHFDKPLSVAIPFKRGLLKQYGLTAENLGMLFALDSLNFDTLGISNVIVDSAENRIFGQVSHFSTVVVRETKGITALKPNENEDAFLRSFNLKQNYPNPFNPLTSIEYQISIASKIDLSIYNILGQKLETLISGPVEAGNYKLEWNARGLSSGIYFYQLKVGKDVQTRKMVLMR